MWVQSQESDLGIPVSTYNVKTPGRVTHMTQGVRDWSCKGHWEELQFKAEWREQRPEGGRKEMVREVQCEPGVQKDGIANSTSCPRALTKNKKHWWVWSLRGHWWPGQKSECRQGRTDWEERGANLQTSPKSMDLSFCKKDNKEEEKGWMTHRGSESSELFWTGGNLSLSFLNETLKKHRKVIKQIPVCSFPKSKEQ